MYATRIGSLKGPIQYVCAVFETKCHAGIIITSLILIQIAAI